MFKRRLHAAAGDSDRREQGGCSALRSFCACSPSRRVGLGVALPGAGVLAFALLPKCPLCWMALLTAFYAGIHVGALACIGVIFLAAVVVWRMKMRA
jgi:hypothetical protein